MLCADGTRGGFVLASGSPRILGRVSDPLFSLPLREQRHCRRSPVHLDRGTSLAHRPARHSEAPTQPPGTAHRTAPGRRPRDPKAPDDPSDGFSCVAPGPMPMPTAARDRRRRGQRPLSAEAGDLLLLMLLALAGGTSLRSAGGTSPSSHHVVGQRRSEPARRSNRILPSAGSTSRTSHHERHRPAPTRRSPRS